MLSFVGKHLRFYPKDFCVCSFSEFFHLNEKGVQPTSMSNEKYVENEIFDSTYHK